MYNKLKKLISFMLIFYMVISCVNIKGVMAATSTEEEITLEIANGTKDEDKFVFDNYVELRAYVSNNTGTIKNVKAYLGNKEYDMEYYYDSKGSYNKKYYWRCNIPIDLLKEGQYDIRVDFIHNNNYILSKEISFKHINTPKLRINSPTKYSLTHNKSLYFNVDVDNAEGREFDVLVYINKDLALSGKNKIDSFSRSGLWRAGDNNNIEIQLKYRDVLIEKQELRSIYDSLNRCEEKACSNYTAEDYNKDFALYSNENDWIVENLKTGETKTYSYNEKVNACLTQNGDIVVLPSVKDKKSTKDYLYVITTDNELYVVNLKNGEISNKLLAGVTFLAKSDDYDRVYVKNGNNIYRIMGEQITKILDDNKDTIRVFESGNTIYYLDKVNQVYQTDKSCTYDYELYEKKQNSTNRIDVTSESYDLSIMMLKGKLYYLKGTNEEYELYRYDGEKIEQLTYNMKYVRTVFEKVNNKFIKLRRENPKGIDYRDENGELIKTEDTYEHWYKYDKKKEIDGELYGFKAGIVYKINELDEINDNAIALRLDKYTLSLKSGEKYILKATTLPSDIKDSELSWSSDNEDVATVNSNGEVTAKGDGKALITVLLKNSDVKATCEVTVSQNEMTLNIRETQIDVGEVISLEAIIETASKEDTKLIWSSSDNSIADVKLQTENYSKCEVIGKSSGIVTITAKTTDGSLYAQCTLKVISKEDLNRDGVVDSLDMAIVASSYNKKESDLGWNSLVDFNNDKIIDIYDLVRVSSKMKN